MATRAAIFLLSASPPGWWRGRGHHSRFRAYATLHLIAPCLETRLLVIAKYILLPQLRLVQPSELALLVFKEALLFVALTLGK